MSHKSRNLSRVHDASEGYVVLAMTILYLNLITSVLVLVSSSSASAFVSALRANPQTLTVAVVQIPQCVHKLVITLQQHRPSYMRQQSCQEPKVVLSPCSHRRISAAVPKDMLRIRGCLSIGTARGNSIQFNSGSDHNHNQNHGETPPQNGPPLSAIRLNPDIHPRPSRQLCLLTPSTIKIL